MRKFLIRFIMTLLVFSAAGTPAFAEESRDICSERKYMSVQVFRPGEVVSYSNYGIALAAYVVERVAAGFCRVLPRECLFAVDN